MRWRKPLLQRLLKSAGLVLIVLAAAPYTWGPIYRFPESRLFSGERLWNPYADARGPWQRANFHAHGHSWMGLTNGRQPDEAVAQRYRDLGYSVPGVSDYQKIAAHHGVATMPLYEHGYNIGKHHQIAIGARDVEWFDFPFWQSLSHRQYVIDRVRRKADLVALAHPSSRDAYSPADLESITGYDLIEIVNGPFAMEDAWDAALSTGHPVWAIANDDTHDLDDARRSAVGWNMIDAASPSTADVVQALKAGRFYAVQRTADVATASFNRIERVELQGTTLTVSVSGAESTFSFIGQNGAIRKTVDAATEASYTLQPNDTYVRTVVRAPQHVLYLNPVVRYDGAQLTSPAAAVDAASTWILRLSLGLGGAVATVLLRRRKGPCPQVASEPVLAGVKRNPA